MRVWVRSPRSSNIRVCEFRLEFLSYIKNKKKKKIHSSFLIFYWLFSFFNMDIHFIFGKKLPPTAYTSLDSFINQDQQNSNVLERFFLHVVYKITTFQTILECVDWTFSVHLTFGWCGG